MTVVVKQFSLFSLPITRANKANNRLASTRKRIGERLDHATTNNNNNDRKERMRKLDPSLLALRRTNAIGVELLSKVRM